MPWYKDPDLKQDKQDKMKIGFCGTMSVGKTTLVKALQEIPEFKGIINLQLNVVSILIHWVFH